MAYCSQPRQTGQWKETVFRPVPNPPTAWSKDRLLTLIDRLDALFNRKPAGWGPRDSIMRLDPILVPLMDRRIRLRLIRLPIRACLEAEARRAYGTRGESAEHKQMKRTAILWMKQCGAADACEECVHVAGRSDACSIASDWIVECGHTRMGKLVDAITGMPNGRFVLIPYQPLEREDGAPRALLAVEFTWDADVSAEVRELEDEKRSALSQAVAEKWMASPRYPRSVAQVGDE